MTSSRKLLTIIAAVTLAACGGEATTQAPGPTAAGPSAAGPTAAEPTAIGSIYARPTPTARPDYVLVAVGDSVAFNSPEDCPGCTSYVDQYAAALEAATGMTVGVQNLSQHNGQTVRGLMFELGGSRLRATAIANADIVLVGIAHNDVPMVIDTDSCDGPYQEPVDWSKFTKACIATEVAKYTPLYEQVFERVVELRAGKPTILRATNRYNDWVGGPGQPLPPKGVDATIRVIKAWNTMICGAAEASGFLCADISTAFNGADGATPSAEGGYLASDYTHPSQQGNDRIAEVLIDLGFAPLVP
jgi:lysophospholipase L1-like esterase